MMKSIKYAYARGIAAFLLLHLSLTGPSIAISADRTTSSIQRTSATPTTCYTLKTPAPTGVYCGTANEVGRLVDFVPIAQHVHSPEDCAQLCGNYPGCKGFNLDFGRICELFLTPVESVAGVMPSNNSYFNAWNMQCFTNVYCSSQAPPSTTSPCSPARTQVVADGGFEFPTHHWTVSSPNITFTENAKLARFGAHYANFTVYENHTATLKQQLSGLNVYQTYYASAYIGLNFHHTVRKCSLSFNIDGQTLFEENNKLGVRHVKYGTQWDHYYTLFRPPRANPMLAVTLRCHPPRPGFRYGYVNYLVDQISIEPAQRSCSFALQLQSDHVPFQNQYLHISGLGYRTLTSNKMEAASFYLINGSHLFSSDRFLTLQSIYDYTATIFDLEFPEYEYLIPCNRTEGYLKCRLQKMHLATQWHYCRDGSLYLMEPGSRQPETHYYKTELKIVYLEQK